MRILCIIILSALCAGITASQAVMPDNVNVSADIRQMSCWNKECIDTTGLIRDYIKQINKIERKMTENYLTVPSTRLFDENKINNLITLTQKDGKVLRDLSFYSGIPLEQHFDKDFSEKLYDRREVERVIMWFKQNYHTIDGIYLIPLLEEFRADRERVRQLESFAEYGDPVYRQQIDSIMRKYEGRYFTTYTYD